MCPSGTASGRAETISGPDFRQAFEVIDTDRDGKISRDDLRKFYAHFSSSSSNGVGEMEDAISTMISTADLNKDGFVEYDEFERVLGGRKRSAAGLNVMEEVFKVMDRDGDGKLSLEDLKTFMHQAGFVNIPDEDVKAMIRLAGADETYGVSYDDLLQILSNHRF